MQALGMSVDKELKLYATGQLDYKGIQNAETHSILQHLANKEISLVSSRVLVSNFQSDGAHRRYSGTEVDLVGYDHHKRSFVITEIKVTGKKIAHLKERNRDEPLVKSCGFRRSEMGRYAAQVACTFLMYANTYTDHNFYSLLVISECDTPKCESFTLDHSLVDFLHDLYIFYVSNKLCEEYMNFIEIESFIHLVLSVGYIPLTPVLNGAIYAHQLLDTFHPVC